MQEVAEKVSTTMDGDDPILIHFFGDILADRSLPSDRNNSAERKQWLRDLPYENWISSKGPKASQCVSEGLNNNATGCTYHPQMSSRLIDILDALRADNLLQHSEPRLREDRDTNFGHPKLNLAP
jgi:hypothetical protein